MSARRPPRNRPILTSLHDSIADENWSINHWLNESLELLKGRRATPRWLYFAWPIIGLLFLGLQIFLLVTAILWTTQSSMINTNSPAFLLYKNTNVEYCLSAGLNSTLDCLLVFQYPDNYHMADIGSGLYVTVQPVWPTIRTDKDSYSLCNQGYCNFEGNGWCGQIGCLNGYLVLPSKPRGSAFPHVGLSAWFALNWQTLTAVYAVWSFRIYKPKHHDENTCRAMRWWNWGFIALDLFSTILWWVAFFRLAVNVTASNPISIINWFIPWRYIDAVKNHPIHCHMNKSPWHDRWWMKNLIYILTGYLIIQWGLTLFSVNYAPDRYGSLNYWIRKGPNYDCLTSLIPYAPGTSPCTPQQICAKTWLRLDPAFTYRSGWNQAVSCYQNAFIACSVLVGTWVIYDLLDKVACSQSTRWSESKISGIGYGLFYVPVTALLLSSFAAAMLVLPALGSLPAREASVNYDFECSVIHVTMSPWRQYFDVDGYARVWRVVNTWFGA
jgi:hypothetical protein